MPKEKPQEMVDRLLKGSNNFSLAEIEKLLKKLGFKAEKELSTRPNKRSIPNQPFYTHDCISNIKIAFPTNTMVIPESFYKQVRECIKTVLEHNPNVLDRFSESSNTEATWGNDIAESRSNDTLRR